MSVTYPDRWTHSRFKPGQTKVASITDVYKTVRGIGASDPGSLLELSFCSHGWMGGPILVDSDDDRMAIVTTTAKTAGERFAAVPSVAQMVGRAGNWATHPASPSSPERSKGTGRNRW